MAAYACAWEAWTQVHVLVPCACSILYQRGIYPQDTFDVAKKYGSNLWLTNEEQLTTYLNTVLKQSKGEGMLHVASQHATKRGILYGSKAPQRLSAPGKHTHTLDFCYGM